MAGLNRLIILFWTTCLFIITMSTGVIAESIVFPSDSGVVNVTQSPYNAVPNDGVDDTAAIQAAFNDYPGVNKIIYLPDGVYDISDTIRWTGDHKRTILQGQSAAGTILRLMPGAVGYNDPQNPKAMIWTGTAPAQRFRNAIRNLTVDVGSGHPGAAGIQFIANNQGCMRNVNIISQDGQGYIGLDMTYTGELGPMLIRDLYVRGFDYGINTYHTVASITFENIVLEDQNVYGWYNSNQIITVRNLHSTNSVTAFFNQKDSAATATIINAQLTGIGSASGVPAIINQKLMYLRDITTTGYDYAVMHDDKGRGNEPGVLEPDVVEWISHGSPVSLFDSTHTSSLRLPVRNTPELPWDDFNNWTSPLAFGGQPNDSVNDTAAIQAAIDSGATTVYLPNGQWNMQGDLLLRGNVRRFIGCEARLTGTGRILFENGTHPEVIMERIDMIYADIDVVHASNRTWILSSVTIDGTYNNTGTGDLFIDDVVCGTFYFMNQRVWARQLNQETDTQQDPALAKITNDGGQVWILGVKTERPGTIVRTINGGYTKMVGGLLYSTSSEKIDPAWKIEDASMSIANVTERCYNGNFIQTWVDETRSGETRTWVPSQPGSHPLLYIGYLTPFQTPQITVDFDEYTITSYSNNQDLSGGAEVLEYGNVLHLTGNTWKKINLPYAITPDTVLQFELNSPQPGEIIGIAMDEDNDHANVPRVFKLAGNQVLPGDMIGSPQTYTGPGYELFQIPIGTFYTGWMNFLAFVMDDDINQNGDAYFRNVTISEIPDHLWPPSSLIATAVNGSTISLTWQDLSDNEDGFIIERSPWHRQTGWTQIADLPANTTEYTDTDSLFGFVEYTYRIGAYDNH